MTESRERRSTDPLIIEMHGMVQRLDQKMDETHRWMVEKTETIKDHENRLKPIEEMQGTLKRVGWVAGIASVPIVGGIGAGIWAWFQSIVSHGKVPQ